MIFQTEKQLKEFGDKIPAEKKAPIETALAKLKEAHKAGDLDQIDSATTELNAAWTAASEEMYKATQDQGGQQPGGDGNGQHQQQNSNANSENVTDAEFEEVK